jgi:hypothetical protein
MLMQPVSAAQNAYRGTAMQALRFITVAGVLFITLTIVYLSRAAAPAPEMSAKAGEYTLTGPYTHNNLTIYLVRGANRLQDKHYLTLQEAMEKKLVVVQETGSVNELKIQNLSPDTDIYIQSGDIVKGGRQDRTIALDFIAPPKSEAMAINAFCVEHGRWTQRGAEDAVAFASSNNAVAGKDLKLAAKASTQASQGEVWQQVRENQAKLTSNAQAPVIDPASPSSYQLTLENQKVRQTTEAYKNQLLHIIDDKPDAIGYVMVINGQLNSSDVYGSHELFAKLWPKMLDSAAVEAFAELKKDQKFEPIKAETVVAAIVDADQAKDASRAVTPRVQLVTRETTKNVLFETRDKESTSPWIHRNYIAKDEKAPARTNRMEPELQQQINAPANQNPAQSQVEQRQQNAQRNR